MVIKLDETKIYLRVDLHASPVANFFWMTLIPTRDLFGS